MRFFGKFRGILGVDDHLDERSADLVLSCHAENTMLEPNTPKVTLDIFRSVIQYANHDDNYDKAHAKRNAIIFMDKFSAIANEYRNCLTSLSQLLSTDASRLSNTIMLFEAQITPIKPIGREILSELYKYKKIDMHSGIFASLDFRSTEFDSAILRVAMRVGMFFYDLPHTFIQNIAPPFVINNNDVNSDEKNMWYKNMAELFITKQRPYGHVEDIVTTLVDDMNIVRNLEGRISSHNFDISVKIVRNNADHAVELFDQQWGEVQIAFAELKLIIEN
jgi:hypothetical protein